MKRLFILLSLVIITGNIGASEFSIEDSENTTPVKYWILSTNM
jgi:hypothetical protein